MIKQKEESHIDCNVLCPECEAPITKKTLKNLICEKCEFNLCVRYDEKGELWVNMKKGQGTIFD